MPKEPLFQIQCTTCNSRLSVRDAKAIGQILNCPKCESMVLVQPPEGWDAETVDDIPSPVAVATAARRQPNRAVPGAADGDESSRQVAAPFDSVTPVAQAASEPGPTPAKTTGETTAPAVDNGHDSGEDLANDGRWRGGPDDPVLPTDQWESNRSAQLRQRMLLITGIIITGVVLVAGVGYLWNRQPQTTQRSNPSAGNAQQAPVEQAPAGQAAGPAENDPSRGGTDAIDQPGQSTPGQAGPEQTSPEQTSPEQTSPEQTSPEQTSPAAVSPDQVDPAEAATPDGAEPVPVGSEPVGAEAAGAAPDDTALPPEATAPGVSPAAEPFPAAADNSGPLAAAAQAEAALDRLERLLRGETVPDVAPGAPLPPPTVRTPMREPVDVAARLAMPLPSLQLEQTPLASLQYLLYQLQHIPVCFDWGRLEARQIAPGTRLQGTYTGGSLGDILSEALAAISARHEVHDGYLWITCDAPASYAATYQLEAFPGYAEGSVRVAELVTQLVAPDSWASGGLGRITFDEHRVTVTQTANVHDALQTLLAQYARQRSDREQLRQAVPEAWRAPITANFQRPTSLAEVFHFLSEEAGIDLSVNWQSAAWVGCYPEIKVMTAATAQPFIEVLETLADDNDLAWRWLDDQTIELRGTAAASAPVRVDVLSMPATANSSADLAARLRDLLGDGNGDLVCLMDTKGGCLLVRGDEAQRAAVARALAQLAPAAPAPDSTAP